MMSPLERSRNRVERGGEACPSGDVQLDHVVHVIDVRIDQLGYAAEAGVIHQRSDAAVGTQRSSTRLSRPSRKVGGQGFGLAAGLRG